MYPPEKPSPLQSFRKALDDAKKDRSFLRERKRQARILQMERRRWEKAQNSATLNRKISDFLDQPNVWLERRRQEKLRQQVERQYASLGTAPPLTPSARLGKAARLWLAGIAEDRERLWQQIAGALGVIAILAIAASLFIYYRFTPSRPLVTIGNRVVQRREYQADLDAAAGKSVLIKIVFSELIRQAAAKAGVTPTPAQIETRLAEMERRGMTVRSGTDKEQLRQSMALALALENLRIQGIQASDAEIADFYRKNAAHLAQPAQVQSILVLTQTEFKAQAATDLLAQGKTAAEMGAQPDMWVDGENNFHVNLDALPIPQHQKILGTALAMHPGQITTFPLQNAFLTIKCLHTYQPSQPPLSQVRDDVARMVKLAKAPSADAELMLLYHANRPNFDMDRYAAYLNDVEQSDPSAPATVSKAVGLP